MDSFKKTVLTLKEKVAELEGRLQELDGKGVFANIHYVSERSEYGETLLDDVNTFRFKMVKGCSYTGNQTDPNLYGYCLINPTQDLYEEMWLQHTNQTGLNREGIRVFTKSSPEEFDDIKNVTLACGQFTQNGQFHGIRITDKIQSIFDKYVFETAKCTHNYVTDCPCNIPFTRKIKIMFKHTYKIRPHVQFDVTKPKVGNLQISLTEITKKYCIFTVTITSDQSLIYKGQPMNTTDGILHWSVHGIIEEPSVSLLDE